MAQFFNREAEMATLDRLVGQDESQLVMVYGRRRVGKTTLLTTWAARSGLPTFYWVAKREARETLMANFARQVWAWEHQADGTEIAFRPPDWDSVFGMLAQAIGGRTCLIILDELPYLLESDPAFASYLQAAWDHRLRATSARVFVSGSHVGMMTGLVAHEAPLYGRLTAQILVQPLAFPDIALFLPDYDVHKRLAVYAILGGIPAYLERWRSSQSLTENIERLFLLRTGWFRNEPLVVISDLTQRETTSYEATLRAIAAGNHSREDIAAASAIPTTSLSHYLNRLLDLQMVERRAPATVPPARSRTSRHNRYFLRDPYLRFYYRFVDPNLHLIEQGLSRRLWTSLEEQFRAFVAASFEELCREWVPAQAQSGMLPFDPEVIGSHWAANAQVDVVAINWKKKQILLGEAKWGGDPVGRGVLRELMDKVARVAPDGGEGWQVHYALFARAEFTEAARAEAAQHGALLLTLPEMEPGLRLTA